MPCPSMSLRAQQMEEASYKILSWWRFCQPWPVAGLELLSIAKNLFMHSLTQGVRNSTVT